MARVPRRLTVVPGHAVHKMWRGHNKEWNLGSDSEKRAYLNFLNEEIESERHAPGCELNAFTLMDNHVHEMIRVIEQKEFSSLMRRHHARYGMYFNRKHERSGKVAEDRPKTCLIKDDEHEMKAVFYVHANPLRAKKTKDVNRYPFSTQKYYALGQKDASMKHVVLPQWYLNLGKTPEIRQQKYRRLFFRYLREEGLEKKSFLHRHFYGPANWVDAQERMLSDWRKAKAPS